MTTELGISGGENATLETMATRREDSSDTCECYKKCQHDCVRKYLNLDDDIHHDGCMVKYYNMDFLGICTNCGKAARPARSKENTDIASSVQSRSPIQTNMNRLCNDTEGAILTKCSDEQTPSVVKAESNSVGTEMLEERIPNKHTVKKNEDMFEVCHEGINNLADTSDISMSNAVQSSDIETKISQTNDTREVCVPASDIREVCVPASDISEVCVPASDISEVRAQTSEISEVCARTTDITAHIVQKKIISTFYHDHNYTMQEPNPQHLEKIHDETTQDSVDSGDSSASHDRCQEDLDIYAPCFDEAIDPLNEEKHQKIIDSLTENRTPSCNLESEHCQTATTVTGESEKNQRNDTTETCYHGNQKLQVMSKLDVSTEQCSRRNKSSETLNADKNTVCQLPRDKEYDQKPHHKTVTVQDSPQGSKANKESRELTASQEVDGEIDDMATSTKRWYVTTAGALLEHSNDQPVTGIKHRGHPINNQSITDDKQKEQPITVISLGDRQTKQPITASSHGDRQTEQPITASSLGDRQTEQPITDSSQSDSGMSGTTKADKEEVCKGQENNSIWKYFELNKGKKDNGMSLEEKLSERNKRNAMFARENRQRKKQYVQKLESENKELMCENKKLKSETEKMVTEIQRLKEETTYLKSVIAHQSTLSGLLKNIPTTCGINLTTSFRSQQSDEPGRKRAKTTTKSSGGVCLHVSESNVSLEFCSKCAAMAGNFDQSK